MHGRFTFSDRRKLEKRIFEYPNIVVATQVIEVSLDIDYDILFTETCYLDSLVQRSGRINRFGHLGNKGQVLVNVFFPEGDERFDRVVRERQAAGEGAVAGEIVRDHSSAARLHRAVRGFHRRDFLSRAAAELEVESAQFGVDGIADAISAIHPGCAGRGGRA